MDFPRTIYAIQHDVTGRIYVGSAADVQKRYKGHLVDLRKNRHRNKEMQRDYNEFGEHYSLFVLGTINNYEHRHMEQLWMKKLKTIDPRIGYNGNDPFFKKRKYPREKRIESGLPIPNRVQS